MRLRPSIIAFRTSPDERWLLVRAARLAGETVSELARRGALQAATMYTVEVPSDPHLEVSAAASRADQ